MQLPNGVYLDIFGKIVIVRYDIKIWGLNPNNFLYHYEIHQSNNSIKYINEHDRENDPTNNQYLSTLFYLGEV